VGRRRREAGDRRQETGDRAARLRAAAFIAGLLAAGPVCAQATSDPQKPPDPAPATPTFSEEVIVVGVTPIHGLGVRRDRVPGNVQVATVADLTATAGIHAGQQLAGALASVHVNEAQASTFQPDLQFRGFTASPLLGLPQGVAVYQNGVRLNEPFGDTMNWDLLPAGAIASVSLMPGSNPLFGLNALGGAVSIQTKTGFSHPGHTVRVSAGSFARRWIEGESGGHGGRAAYFVAARLLDEGGWRDFSPSRVRQIFAHVERRGEAGSIGASVTAGRNRLIGNGPAPVELVEEDRTAVFTHPDETRTAAMLVTVGGQRALKPDVMVEAVVFYRPASVRTLNGDATTYGACAPPLPASLLCDGEGDGPRVTDQAGRFVPVDPAAPLDAANNTTATTTRGWGGNAQISVSRRIRGRDNYLVGGLSLDQGRSRYESLTELARLTATRGTSGTGLLDAGASVAVESAVRHGGAYAADFFTVSPRVTVSASARFTRSTVRLRDRRGTSLTGDHLFSKLNPAAGATFQLARAVTAFGGFSRASRVPTPSELSCADPDDPCRLPNAFLSDPPLLPVVARTWESGLRGQAKGTSWAASVFHTASRDDIIFVSSGALTNQGHFANVGDTARVGLELNAAGTLGRSLHWRSAYTWLRATFDSPLTLTSPHHPDARAGEIAVPRGASLPGVPRHSLRAEMSFTARRLSLAAHAAYSSSIFLRGDEANRLPPIRGAATANVSGGYALYERVRIVARATNVLGARYATFGVLGDPSDVLGDDYTDPRFVSPGAPRAAWIGLEWSLPRVR
jgi:outer membrane cobalamin receptor